MHSSHRKIGDFYAKKNKKILEDKLQTNLNDVVLSVLGISLDVFAKDILDDDKFKVMKQKKFEHDKKLKDGSDIFFSLYPKTEDDWYPHCF